VNGPAELIARAQADPSFVQRLVLDPVSATEEIDLTDRERAILAARTPEELLGLAVTGGAALACDPATCAVTYPSPHAPVDECDGTLAVALPGEALSEAARSVVEEARRDPSFFKRLEADPDGTLDAMEIPLEERTVFVANLPEQLLGLLIGSAGRASGCDETCGFTCSGTCSGGYTMSCGATCNYTCDYTAGIQLWTDRSAEEVALSQLAFRALTPRVGGTGNE
jgi:hypothetical protein